MIRNQNVLLYTLIIYRKQMDGINLSKQSHKRVWKAKLPALNFRFVSSLKFARQTYKQLATIIIAKILQLKNAT